MNSLKKSEHEIIVSKFENLNFSQETNLPTFESYKPLNTSMIGQDQNIKSSDNNANEAKDMHKHKISNIANNIFGNEPNARAEHPGQVEEHSSIEQSERKPDFSRFRDRPDKNLTVTRF